MDRLTIEVGPSMLCDGPGADCAALAAAEYGSGFYANPTSPLSVVDLGDWKTSRVARYNARKCEGLGFVHWPGINRHCWEADLHELRASAPERQGRAMPSSYLEFQEYPSDERSACARHDSVVHGVTSPGGKLVAYAQVVQCGEAVRFNTILGHADYLADGAVWLLVLRLLEYHRDVAGALHGIYYTHDSGSGGGLRYFKERFGFRPAEVEWLF